MDLNKLSVKNKNINLYNKLSILFICNQRKKIKFNIRINI